MIDGALIISNGITGEKRTMKGIETNTLSISDIRQRYRVVILDWCGFLSIKKVSRTVHEVETDIGKAIEAIQQQFGTLGIDETVPLIINSNLDIGEYPCTNEASVEFLVRRILSDNQNHNNRRLVIVTEGKKGLRKGITDVVDKIGDNIELLVENQSSFLDTLGGEEKFDGIMLPESSKHRWPVNNTNPDFPIAWGPRRFDDHSEREIVLSDEEELQDLGFNNYWDIVARYKTVKCGQLWGYKTKPSENHIQSFCMRTLPKFDIPDFLGRCPRV